MFFEHLLGHFELPAANYAAPGIETFPFFEEGNVGDADQLAVAVILLLPVIKGCKLVVVLIH